MIWAVVPPLLKSLEGESGGEPFPRKIFPRFVFVPGRGNNGPGVYAAGCQRIAARVAKAMMPAARIPSAMMPRASGRRGLGPLARVRRADGAMV